MDYYYLLIWGLRRFQHRTGHITTGSWEGRGNQYIQLVKVLYCELPTNGKQLPAFPLEAMLGTEPRSQRWDTKISVNNQHEKESIGQFDIISIQDNYLSNAHFTFQGPRKENGVFCPLK